MGEIGNENVDRTTIMKESTVQSEKMLDIAKERNAVWTEMDLFNILLMSMKCLSYACQELKTSYGIQECTNDFSATKDSKKFIYVLLDSYNNTLRSVEKHTAQCK